MIISTAKHLKLSKVFVPDQQTSMSVKMFSMMSLGRGAQVAEQMSLITKVDGVELVRVMMDLTSDDLLDYLSSLDRIGMENLVAGNKSRRIDSIRSQCEDFILTLQKDYPSTVPTLARIGVKLDSTLLSSSDPQVSKCPLCKLRHDQGSESESIGFCYGCSKILGEMKDASILRGMLEPR
jgi:cytoplasmic tRNA 2-thiolation protein 2